MSLIVDLSDADSVHRVDCGGKAEALSRLIGAGFTVPQGVVVTTEAYGNYVQESRLSERIHMEIHRKRSEDLRWEEMWDAALRIRNLFQKAPLPDRLEQDLKPVIKRRFGDRPVVVRSSAPTEDSLTASFAGLHESFVNVRGVDSILYHVRLVWASLWSDAALLYSEDSNTEPGSDAMAVIIQDLVDGERSGVAFSVDPTDSARGVLEAIHGLNKGLVDGDIEPDRWFIRRTDGKILQHDQPERDRWVRITDDGFALVPLGELGTSPPLTREEVGRIWKLTGDTEQLFGSTQDVEWTLKGDEITILQSRPITRGISEKTERGSKAWNLGLKRSFDHLVQLRERIETIHFPGMLVQEQKLAAFDLTSLTDHQLAEEINRREKIFKHWEDIYWDEFIPMAHGVRLFGQAYNDIMAPDDPFQFVDLLRNTPLISRKRNRDLEDLAAVIRGDKDLAESLEKSQSPEDHDVFSKKLEKFMEDYGGLTWGSSRLSTNRETLVRLLLNLASAPAHQKQNKGEDPEEDLVEQFLLAFPGDRRIEGERLLDLARASWHLRDDDNIFLGRIEGQLQRSVDEGLERLGRKDPEIKGPLPPGRVAAALENPHGFTSQQPIRTEPLDRVRPRQLVGQPANQGIARGKARIVGGFEDLSQFQAGQILICDSVDPNMTLLVPMASAIVERRGGMLIHGAIIAREYGIPCVNGVPDAIRLIRNGDDVTVDGFLGLVIVHGH